MRKSTVVFVIFICGVLLGATAQILFWTPHLQQKFTDSDGIRYWVFVHPEQSERMILIVGSNGFWERFVAFGSSTVNGTRYCVAYRLEPASGGVSMVPAWMARIREGP